MPADTSAGINRGFWEDELELSVDEPLARAGSPDHMRAWIASRTGRQVNVLCRCLGIAAAQKPRARKASLQDCNGGLVPYYLVDCFARHKGRFAITDLALAVLDEDILELCQGKDEDTFDKWALLYGLYRADPENLRMLFHLDKIHKSGFARMALKQKVRQPKENFEAFLQPAKASEVLEAYDRAKRDHRPSQLKNVVRHDHHHLVFIRRPERPLCILRNGGIQHGFRAEWIILDFADNARRVNISSDSPDVPLEMANALASAYFGREVEYENECQITYAKQIARLLDQMKAGTCNGLSLVYLEVRGSPVHGVDLRLWHDDEAVMRRAVAAIERDHGNLSADIERIEKVKVVYENKRVDVRFEKQDTGSDEYIVRYFDHRLNASMRRRFEDFMRDTHGIPILSTEKRFKRRA